MKSPPATTLLIASDNASDAALVKNLLEAEFERVFVTTDPAEAASGFDTTKPEVLVLAFRSLEKAEHYNLALFRHSREIHRKPHRTLVLCHRDEVQRAYELCREQIFDDYHLFWPIALEPTRLFLAVHQASRALATPEPAHPTAVDFAAQVRRVGELEQFLNQQMADGDAHIAGNVRAIAEAEQEIATAFTGFSRRLSRGDLPDLVEVRNAAGLEAALDQLRQEALAGPLGSLSASVGPLQRWAEAFRQGSATHLESLRALHALAEEVKPTVLVVDDDSFQQKIVTMLLSREGYRLVSARSGLEALNLLHKLEPDLILMDIAMPDMDGLEVTRRIKGVARFQRIPIIMITGNSEREVVAACLQAGASDFMVKPLSRAALVGKLARLLNPAQVQEPDPLCDLAATDVGP